MEYLKSTPLSMQSFIFTSCRSNSSLEKMQDCSCQMAMQYCDFKFYLYVGLLFSHMQCGVDVLLFATICLLCLSLAYNIGRCISITKGLDVPGNELEWSARQPSRRYEEALYACILDWKHYVGADEWERGICVSSAPTYCFHSWPCLTSHSLNGLWMISTIDLTLIHCLHARLGHLRCLFKWVFISVDRMVLPSI